MKSSTSLDSKYLGVGELKDRISKLSSEVSVLSQSSSEHTDYVYIERKLSYASTSLEKALKSSSWSTASAFCKASATHLAPLNTVSHKVKALSDLPENFQSEILTITASVLRLEKELKESKKKKCMVTNLSFFTALTVFLNQQAALILATVSLLAVGSAVAANASVAPPAEASVEGYVFSDTNANFYLDSDESKFSDVTVSLMSESGSFLGSQITGLDGFYKFDDVDPGNYYVEYQLDTGPFLESSEVFVLPGQMQRLSASVVPPQSVSGVVTDGKTGAVVSANVELVGPEVLSLTTGRDGAYMFEGYLPGEYDLIVTLKDGRVVSKPFSSFSPTLLTENIDVPPLMEVSGRVWFDTNQNAVFDEDELPQPGVAVLLTSGEDTVVSTVSAADGSYSIQAASKTYFLKVETSGLATTEPLIVKSSSTDNDFGVVELGTFEGLFYDDANSNGTLDSNEVSYGGAELVLLRDTKVVATVLVSDTGEFRFEDIPFGEYTLDTGEAGMFSVMVDS